ncbi:MAG: 6-phosphogluconolactonase [Frankiaceae bacterium]|jgi:6-phosphogluconolactonase|nr:6-phosphogluconolactonase [Frankiaceae bacterium]
MSELPDGRRVLIHADAAALADEVAEGTVRALSAAQAGRGRAALVVTGGSIIDRVLGRLRAAGAGALLDWGRVDVWWGDERFVAADSPERNDRQAWAAGLGDLGLDEGRVHRMPAAGGAWGEDLDAAAAGYAHQLARAARDDPGAGPDLPRLDVILLGMGPDGHCASLFPGHRALGERTRAVVAVRDSPKPPPLRTSLTPRALDGIDRVWFVVSSPDKAEAVAAALGGAPVQQRPAAGPRGRVETAWFLDRDAASRLPG